MSEFAVMGASRIDSIDPFKLIDTILGSNEKDLSETLKEVASEIDVCHISYIRFAQDKSADTSIFTASTTYSKNGWPAISSRNTCTPIRSSPMDGTPLRRSTGKSWQAATPGSRLPRRRGNHGVGRNGLSIPVRNRKGVFFAGLLHQQSSQGRMGTV